MNNVIILTSIITLGILLLTVCMPTDGKIIYVNKLTSSSKCLVVNDFRKCNKNVKVNVCNKNGNIYGNASLDLVNQKYGLTPCKSIPCSKGSASDTAVSNCPNCTSAKSGQRCDVEAYTSSKGKKVTISKCFTVGSKKPVNISVEVKVCKANDTSCNTTSLCIGPKGEEPLIINACEPNPCLNGGVCHSEYNQSEYTCNCTQPMSGKNCQELDCKPNCFRWDDTVYYMLNDSEATASWDKAYQTCRDKGLTLAMIKDNETNHFVQFTLLNNSFNILYEDPNFWIGSNRTSENADWKWVDGSAVDKYHITADPGDEPRLCVRMKAYYGMNIRESVCLIKKRGEIHYPLCQKTYPSLKIPRVNLCNPNPCLHGSVCELTANNADYQCKKCRYPSGGKNCSELPCGATPCFAVQDSVFFLHGLTLNLSQMNLNWSQANQSCATANQAMAVINDEAAHHAIKVQMFILYSKSKHGLQDYWIGLNPTSANKPLTWTDGSSAGTYIRNKFPNVVEDKQCVKLFFDTTYNDYSITHVNCNEHTSKTALPLCQTLYPLPTV